MVPGVEVWSHLIQAEVDNFADLTFRSFLSLDLLIPDALSLHHCTSLQCQNLYQLIIRRHRVSRFVITISRAVEERLSLIDEPILSNRALGRSANDSFQIVIEETSYRERLSPHRKHLVLREVIEPTTRT